MYRNISHSNRTSTIRYGTWDSDGNRIERVESVKPYIFTESEKDSNAISIFNTKLKKREFDNESDRRNFVENYKGRVFYNIPIKQQFILDKFSKLDMAEMTKFELKTFFLDIEVYSPDCFPEADQANYPINIITIYDTETMMFYTWGIGEYYYNLEDLGIDESNVKYIECSSEKELLSKFVKFWRSNFPDIVSGWNSASFDIPYLVNRLNSIFGEDKAKQLSPTNIIFSKTRKNYFDKFYTHWTIDGVSDIDYMELYAKSIVGQQESYKLDYIAKVEEVGSKVEFESSNLSNLADTDWDTFVKYNIQDVNIMVNLEKKKRYLVIARGKAYRGYSTLDKCLDSVPIVTGMIAKSALDENKIIVTFKPKKVDEEFEGGFVFSPSGKMHTGIVSFDVNSLYPNTMITLNTSPETKLGKVNRLPTGDVEVVLVNGKHRKMSESEYKTFITKNDIIVSKSNIIFSQKKRGICAKFLDDLYKERKVIKAKMSKEKDPAKLEQMDIEQYLVKILLNSVYGVFGNPYFCLYDIDIASSVTLTGQAMIKTATELVKEFAKTEYKIDNLDNFIVYGDTDSCFFDFGKITDAVGITFFENNKVTKEAIGLIDNFTENLNNRINTWAKTELNSNDPRYLFSREKICLRGIFLTKKNYILRVVNNENKDCDKLVEAGVELKKSTHSEPIKNLMRGVIECMFYDKGKPEADSRYIGAMDTFKELPVEDIAKRGNVKTLDKFVNKTNHLKILPNTPQHYKGAIYYNYLIDSLNLGSKYPKIASGQKVKLVYLHPNKYGFDCIAFLDKFPTEFELFPDYEKQFSKMVTSLIQRCYSGNDWNLPSVDKSMTTDLFSFMDSL